MTPNFLIKYPLRKQLPTFGLIWLISMQNGYIDTNSAHLSSHSSNTCPLTWQPSLNIYPLFFNYVQQARNFRVLVEISVALYVWNFGIVQWNHDQCKLKVYWIYFVDSLVLTTSIL